MYKSIVEVNKRVIEHKNELHKLNKDYFFVALQGSWNYNLGYEKSDVDTKALILPEFNDIVLNNKPISTTHLMENEEHLDMKDIRVMFQNFWKQNINFLEILFSGYVSINPSYLDEYFKLTDMAEDIAHYDEAKALNCMCGMVGEKLHALEHVYPATAADIERFGYSPKEFHHILRMRNFIDAYTRGIEFSKCLVTFDVFDKEKLMKAKRGEYSLEVVRDVAQFVYNRVYEVRNEYFDQHELVVRNDVKVAAEEVVCEVLKKKFRNDLEC